MDALPERAATPPSAAGELPATRLEIAGQQLLAEPRQAFRVELAEPGLLGLRSRDGRVVLLEDEDAFALLGRLARIRQRGYPARQIVIFGGGPALRRRLEAGPEPIVGAWVLHCDVSGHWQNRPPRRRERNACAALERAASQAFARRSWSAGEAEAHHRRLEHEREQARSEARELDRFRLLLGQRWPRATFALMASIAIVFGLEALWGGVDLPPLLSAMGSLVPERARAGEWWRFFACSFLHGGLLHVGLNLLVLWMLGRSLERAIGSTRFLLIYFGAALAGSAASSLAVEGQSVGASGAIWGLLGAEAAMAFYPQPLLPPVLLPIARRTALANLGINLLASLLPRVDLAAHIGGGIAGALVLLLLARSRQLPVQSPVARPAPLGLRLLAALAVVSFGVGFVTAQAAGRPWRLAVAPELERVVVSGFPWSVELPRGAARAGGGDGNPSIEIGDLRHDPNVIQIQWASLAQGSPRSVLDAELTELERELRGAQGLELLSPPRLVTQRGRPGEAYISVRYRFARTPETLDDWAIGVSSGMRVRVHVSGWTALPRASDGLALRVLGSLGPLDAAPPAR